MDRNAAGGYWSCLGGWLLFTTLFPFLYRQFKCAAVVLVVTVCTMLLGYVQKRSLLIGQINRGMMKGFTRVVGPPQRVSVCPIDD